VGRTEQAFSWRSSCQRQQAIVSTGMPMPRNSILLPSQAQGSIGAAPAKGEPKAVAIMKAACGELSAARTIVAVFFRMT